MRNTPIQIYLNSSGTQTHYLDSLEFCGHFAVVVRPVHGTPKSFDIWILREDRLWFNAYHIDCIPGTHKALGFSEDGVEMFLEGVNHELLFYNRATQTLKHLGILDFTGFPGKYTATVPPAPAPISSSTSGSDVSVQAASKLVAGSNLEGAIEQILDMG
ncbi:hypothetical protein PTKIN_Ptkin02bG0007900 [Pterospermum kingtungense]